MRVLKQRGSDAVGSREGRGLRSLEGRRGTVVDEVFDIQLGDRTEEMIMIINHLDDEGGSLLHDEDGARMGRLWGAFGGQAEVVTPCKVGTMKSVTPYEVRVERR